VPVFKNRTVLEMARNLRGFLSLEVGLTRGPVPNLEQMLKQAQSQAERQGRQLAQAQGQISQKVKQLAQAQEQLSEKDHHIAQTRERLLESDRQLAQSRKRLSEKDRQIAALQASIALEIKSKWYNKGLHSDIAAALDKIPIDLLGGCSLSKAYMLAWLIGRYGLKETVDIGVYRGRSLFPQALAHRRFTEGVVYGVDPWSAAEAREKDISLQDEKDEEAINRFIDQVDWQTVYYEVESMKNDSHYEKHCVLLRKTSADAVAYFQDNGISFDMVHVDGNHDTEKVIEDVRLYLPHLRDNGFLILDDVSFKSVQPAYDELNANTTLVFERIDQDRANDYAVFRKNPSSPDARYDRRLWIRNFW
jgi:hypothetical protein